MGQLFQTMLRGGAAFLLAAVIIAAPARAQESAGYLAEYKAYSQAIESGDREAAINHGRAAWLSAEDALGDDRLTAILAFNYGQLVIFSDSEAAVEALRRADALRALAADAIPASELNLFLAYAEFVVGGEKRREANELRDALEAIEAEGASAQADIAMMWYRLATSDTLARRYSTALESASKAETAFAVAMPDAYRLRASAIMFHGVALLMPIPRTADVITLAHEDFLRARDLFPPQKDIDTVDGILGQAIAWDGAALAAYSSLGKNSDELERDALDDRLFEDSNPNPEECDVEWIERTPPVYPYRAELRGYIGAVIIGYHFEDDTQVHDARIVAAVPDKVFSDIVLKNVENWRLKEPVPNKPGCRRNHLSKVTFVIEE